MSLVSINKQSQKVMIRSTSLNIENILNKNLKEFYPESTYFIYSKEYSKRNLSRKTVLQGLALTNNLIANDIVMTATNKLKTYYEINIKLLKYRRKRNKLIPLSYFGIMKSRLNILVSHKSFLYQSTSQFCLRNVVFKLKKNYYTIASYYSYVRSTNKRIMYMSFLTLNDISRNLVNKGFRAKRFGNYKIRRYRRIKLYYSGFRIGLLNTKHFPQLRRSLVKSKSNLILKFNKKNQRRFFRVKLRKWYFQRKYNLRTLFFHGEIPRASLKYRKRRIKIKGLNLPITISKFKPKSMYKFKLKRRKISKLKYRVKNKLYDLKTLLRYLGHPIYGEEVSGHKEIIYNIGIKHKYRYFKKIMKTRRKLKKVYLKKGYRKYMTIFIRRYYKLNYYYGRRGRRRYGRFLTIFVRRMKRLSKILYHKFQYNIRPKLLIHDN